MKASIAIQSLPTASSEAEMLRIIDAVIAHIQSSGLNYVVTPFETVIEGDALLAEFAVKVRINHSISPSQNRKRIFINIR